MARYAFVWRGTVFCPLGCLETMKNTISIKRNSDFTLVYKKGKYYSGRVLTLYVLKNIRFEEPINCIGITASRKTGKSVKRNRLKRLVRENYRAYESFLLTGHYLVFVIRSVLDTPDYGTYAKEMKYLFRKANLFDMEKWPERANNG